MPHSSPMAIFTPCVITGSSLWVQISPLYKGTSYSGSVPCNDALTWLNLQRPFFQIRSLSEVLELDLQENFLERHNSICNSSFWDWLFSINILYRFIQRTNNVEHLFRCLFASVYHLWWNVHKCLLRIFWLDHLFIVGLLKFFIYSIYKAFVR